MFSPADRARRRGHLGREEYERLFREQEALSRQPTKEQLLKEQKKTNKLLQQLIDLQTKQYPKL